MTMRVVYLRDHDGHKADKEYFVERTLGRRLCENGVAIPFVDYEKKQEAAAEARAKAEAEKKAKAEKLLKEKEAATREMAVSKKAKTRSKAVKK